MRHVIVGGGQAALSAAAKLRELDADCTIRLICGEPTLPYQRPPLSKAYLSGEMPLERLLLRPADWYVSNRIDVSLGVNAVDLDPVERAVVLADGSTETYDRLLLATGTLPRRWPDHLGGGLDNVFALRGTLDSDALRPLFVAGNRLAIIGGGYVGLEVAAVARTIGLTVTLIEMADRVLQRVAAPATSDFFRELHRGHGVEIRESTATTRLVGETRAEALELASGDLLPVDFVLVGIGVAPNESLAQHAGITVGNGITVDDRCRTSHVDIYSAGDCASFPHLGQHLRLESVPHAIHHGEVAAANMVGQPLRYDATPWFWSDQYDVKLQIAGLNSGYDRTVTRPGRRDGAQSVWYYAGDRLLAVDAMNDAPAFMVARRIIEAGKSVPPDIAADAASNLKDWM